MARSINIPAIKVMHLIGPQTAIRYARMMGVKPSTPLDPVLSLALGSSPVSPLEMASIYSTFPAGGNHPEPSAWTRLADSQDTVLEDVPPAIETHVLQKDTVSQLDDMLQAVVNDPGGTGYMVKSLVPDARGKTGTTQEHKDVWFVGYTPQLVCAVWAGHPIYKTKRTKAAYGQEMAHNAFGGTICAPIWAKFMSQAVPIFKTARAKELAREKAKLPPVGKPVTSADTAAAVEVVPANSDSRGDTLRERRRSRNSIPHDNGDGTVTVPVDDNTGLLAPEGSSNSHPETFTAGSQPTTLSPQYTGAQDNTGSGDGSNPDSSDNSSPTSTPSESTDSSRSHRRRRHRASEDSVTVTINPEDGLRATKWDPQTVTRSYPRGQEPQQYSRMYPPPPGEQ